MSAGSGTLVTIYYATNVLWNKITPIFFIFQKVLFRHEFLRSAPTSYIVSSYPCGLMMLENYYIVLIFFVKHIKAFKNSTINWCMS